MRAVQSAEALGLAASGSEGAMAEATLRRGPGRQQSEVPDLEAIDEFSAETVERQVYRRLRNALARGRVAPGATLTSRSLAQSLGVSVQPVRDALKRLEADGVLEGRPQSGFFLKGITRQEYRELTEIRQRLEGFAGWLACQAMDRQTLVQLKRINERITRHANSRAAMEENYRFHFTIYGKANRPNLLALIENLWVRIGPALHHHPYSLGGAARERHLAIIRALEAGDAEATEQAIVEDLGSTADQIVQHLP